MILLIDNYDSFSYNLVRYLRLLGQEVVVARNDAVELAELANLCQAIVISPGPKTPAEAGECLAIVRSLASSKPMLGICLGHQVIYEAFGGLVVRAVKPVHGRTTPMQLAESALFAGIPDRTPFARYHSLIGQPASLPTCLQVIAWSPEQEIMAVAHREFCLFGVQFHPESVLSTAGFQLLANFLHSAGLPTPATLPTNDYTLSALTNITLEEESEEQPVVLPTAYSMLT